MYVFGLLMYSLRFEGIDTSLWINGSTISLNFAGWAFETTI